MARTPYLVRRACGSYQLQIRLRPALASAFGKSHFKFALQTHNLGAARQRLNRTMTRISSYIHAEDVAAMGRAIRNDMLLELRLGQTIDGSRYLDRELIERAAREFNEKIFPEHDIDIDMFAFGKTFVEFSRMQEAEHTAFKGTERGRILLASDLVAAPSAIMPTLIAAPSPEMRSITRDLAAFGETLQRVLASVSSAHANTSLTNAVQSVANTNPAITLGEAIEQFLIHEKRLGRADSRAEKAKSILAFLDAYLKQPLLADVTDTMLEEVDRQLVNIPGVRGFSTAGRKDLFARYTVADQHHKRKGSEDSNASNWDNKRFDRMAVSSIEVRFHILLNAFFKWARERKFSETVYHFHIKDKELNSVLPRDALSNSAAISVVSLPLFTGSAGPGARDRWRKGTSFVQDHIYWTLLVLLFTGMRTGEGVALRVDQIREGDEFHYFDLRPFDPAKGRVPLSQLKEGKTENAARLIPIHPLLIELGFLEWRDAIAKSGEVRLFPQWRPPTDARGKIRWGDPVTKLWRTVEKCARITEKNVSAYSLRHLFADWLDRVQSAQRTRNRMVGHVDTSNEADNYGSKGYLAPEVASVVLRLGNETITEIARILLEAKDRANSGLLEAMPIGQIIRFNAMRKQRDAKPLVSKARPKAKEK